MPDGSADDVGLLYLKSGFRPSLILRADGTFVARDIPGPLIGFDGSFKYPPASVSGSGEWRFEKQQDWVVSLTFEEAPDRPGRKSFPVNMYNQKIPYQLGFYLDDPDAGHVLMFARRPVSR